MLTLPSLPARPVVRLFATLILSLMIFCTPAFAAEIRLSVAASMTDAMKELISVYQQQHEEVICLPNFGSSGTLAKQIAQGAPSDLFISANPRWMTYLVEEGLIPADKVRTLAFNSLVFVGRPGPTINNMQDLARLQRIAIGSPRSVPAGQYAEQALKGAGMYDEMVSKLMLAQDVRQALVYADRGETDGAFVYKTDALLAKDAVILFEVPQNLYDEVTYPLGLTAEGMKNQDAVAFTEFLSTDEASAILKKYGFVVL